MKKSRLHSLLVVTIAVSALVMSTACSRKSSGGQQPVQTSQGKQAPRHGQGELDRDSGKSSQQGRAVDDDSDLDGSGGPIISVDADGNEIPSAPKNRGPLAELEPIVVHNDPSGMTASEIYESSAALGDSAPGVISDVGDRLDAYRYSGASFDDLRSQLTRHVNAKDKTRRVRDGLFAKEIDQATVDIDWSNQSARITLLMNGRRTHLTFDTGLGHDLVMRAGSVKRGKKIGIIATCMDLSGGCETVHIMVQDGNLGYTRTAHVIARTTKAMLYTQGNGYNVARNEEYNYFLNLLLNTVGHSGRLNTVDSLNMRTTEVIGGASNYIVQMGLNTTRSGFGTLVWSGPLVKKNGSSVVSAPAELLYSSSPIADTIRETKLIRNDGRGNLQLAVTIRRATVEAEEDTLTLTFGRIHKPTMAVRFK